MCLYLKDRCMLNNSSNLESVIGVMLTPGPNMLLFDSENHQILTAVGTGDVLLVEDAIKEE